jgi:threonyl-tRNA synthetase
MLVVGDGEEQAGAVAVRRHREGDEGTMSLDEFAQRLARERVERSG